LHVVVTAVSYKIHFSSRIWADLTEEGHKLHHLTCFFSYFRINTKHWTATSTAFKR